MLIILFLNFKSVGKKPELVSLSKSVANPGDTITLNGNYFGGEISRGRVYINEQMVYQDFIRSWSNHEITLTLTEDFTSGMITVINMYGESKPYLITSFKDVPVIENEHLDIGDPHILSAKYLDDSNLKIGITGGSFGAYQEKSQLKISAISGEEIILDSGYISEWSDDLITIFLPYGMNNLILSVMNSHGISNEITLHNNGIPSVLYNNSDTRMYNMEQVVEIKDVIALKNSFINLFIPRVSEGYNQKITLVESGIGEYNSSSNTYDFVIPVDETGFEFNAELLTHVEISSLEATIRKDILKRDYDSDSPHYKAGFLECPGIEVSKDIRSTSVWLVRNSTNRYNQVEILMKWVLTYLKISEDSSDDATIGFSERSVSSKGLVNLTISMLRSVGIPSRLVTGIKQEEGWVNYQWMEFYLPDSGWIPLDLLRVNDDSNYNIGQIENSRISFTRGINIIEYEDNEIIPDFYALQNSISNFEGNIESYSAIWHNVFVN